MAVAIAERVELGSARSPSHSALSVPLGGGAGEVALSGTAHGVGLSGAPQALARSRRAALDTSMKRALDVIAALVLLVALAPALVAVAALVKLDSRGPLLYGCRRRGLGGREIRVLKFRKMRDGSRGAPLTVGIDERFTRVGRFLASTRLDELPQLWNVLRGDMSLVGPRPEDPSFVALRGTDYDHILRVRPGITGLSQLAFARESDILVGSDPIARYVEQILPQKTGLDTLYACERTLAMDLRILLWTLVPVVFRIDVSVERATGRIALRRRKGGKRTAR
jgi:lipopolysaccharide/colanic/teichoic acid biosynthesis glycosyltransferase